MDRHDSAGDNAEPLYRYARTHAPSVRHIFVIERSSPDWETVIVSVATTLSAEFLISWTNSLPGRVPRGGAADGGGRSRSQRRGRGEVGLEGLACTGVSDGQHRGQPGGVEKSGGDTGLDGPGDGGGGRLRMGPVRVEWIRDEYGDGLEDWVAVNVAVDGKPFDTDGYSHLDDAVKDAARTTMEWQRHCDVEIRDEIVSWLEHRDEFFDVLGPQDDEEGDSWTITWGDVMVRRHYDKVVQGSLVAMRKINDSSHFS